MTASDSKHNDRTPQQFLKDSAKLTREVLAAADALIDVTLESWSIQARQTQPPNRMPPTGQSAQ
jgi:hypothetical protein